MKNTKSKLSHFFLFLTVFVQLTLSPYLFLFSFILVIWFKGNLNPFWPRLSRLVSRVLPRGLASRFPPRNKPPLSFTIASGVPLLWGWATRPLVGLPPLVPIYIIVYYPEYATIINW